jgi:CheY-like chemotaxis protein
MKILLVEDHPAVADITCDLLRDLHEHEVVHATTGAEALAALEHMTPDLVLLDVNLPDVSGYEVAMRMRRDPRWSSTVLVALTGFGNDVDPSLAKEAGIDAHFRKPMDFDLLPTIKRASPP